MSEFVALLTSEFLKNGKSEIAAGQKAYIRGKFEYFGLKTNDRRVIQKPFLVKQYLPPKMELFGLVKELNNKPQRDFHLFAQELVFKYIKQFEKIDIDLLEYMVINNSWWDTVDFIAVKLMGAYFKKYPNEIEKRVNQYIKSNNIWLQRSALLFQLKYKDQINTNILDYTIKALLGSKEFFINKAIGWVLREYSRTNPDWVVDFVEKTELSNLSKKEALRLL